MLGSLVRRGSLIEGGALKSSEKKGGENWGTLEVRILMGP